MYSANALMHIMFYMVYVPRGSMVILFLFLNFSNVRPLKFACLLTKDIVINSAVYRFKRVLKNHNNIVCQTFNKE